MNHYIAFLRAINVGGRNIKMAELRQHFDALGFANVETFIASGNVIFHSPDQNTEALERTIEAHLQQVLGYEVDTFLRTLSEVAEVAAYQPFPTSASEGEGTLFVAFLHSTPDDGVQERVAKLASEVDDFHMKGQELYWLCQIPSHKSKVSGAVLERTLGCPTTLRNINTVRRLTAKYS